MLLRPLASHIKVQYLHRGRNKSSIRAISYRLQDRNMETLVKALGETGQTHVLDGWDRLDADQRVQLSKDVEEFDFGFVKRVFDASMSAAESNEQGVKPYNEVLALNDGTAEQRAEWRKHGLSLIAQGKVAIVLLAGGQGTRLGSALPKGCYDIGLPSHKSLFQLQAERILRLQQLAGEEEPQPGPGHKLHWAIMTSPFTHEDTLSHFKSNKFFGLDEDQVFFFQQGALPCLTEEGRVIMSSACTLAKAPDGNGGVYMALASSGVLSKLESMGVEAVDVYCVDNALASPGDPLFVGYCHTQQAEVGARVVAKAYPEEKVGVFASREGRLVVVEYSELDPKQASASDPDTGKLLYNWSNICMHYFSLPWLKRVHEHVKGGGAPYHVARKKIPSKDGPVQGIKLELFIFDTFHTAGKVSLMEVDRAAQFAPVKNAPGSSSDSPDTAREAVLAQGVKWVKAAGGSVQLPEGVAGIEVPPLMSYGGEGLEAHVKDKVFDKEDALVNTA